MTSSSAERVGPSSTTGCGSFSTHKEKTMNIDNEISTDIISSTRSPNGRAEIVLERETDWALRKGGEMRTSRITRYTVETWVVGTVIPVFSREIFTTKKAAVAFVKEITKTIEKQMADFYTVENLDELKERRAHEMNSTVAEWLSQDIENMELGIRQMAVEIPGLDGDGWDGDANDGHLCEVLWACMSIASLQYEVEECNRGEYTEAQSIPELKKHVRKMAATLKAAADNL